MNDHPLGKSITTNRMMGTEQPYKILLPTTKIGRSITIANTLRTDTENRTDPTIQPKILHPKQATEMVHSECNHFPIRNLNSGIDVTIYGRNIDNPTGMNPQGPIGTTIPESNRANNCNIFDLVISTSDLS